MRFWLIQDGKECGPFQDYELREKIVGGDLSEDDLVWYEGLGDWKKISEVDLFKGEFTRMEVKLPDSKVSANLEESPPTPPPIKRSLWDKQDGAESKTDTKKQEKNYVLRRFWARWCDLICYSAIWWLLMYIAGRDIGAAIRNPWLLLTLFIPWFAIEAWLIQRFGQTPGKWLLGISVKNDDGSNLSLKAAIWRSFRVMITGIGFGWGLLSILCQGMSLFTTKRLGKTAWDFVGGHKVEVEKPLRGFKVAGMVVAFFIAAQLQMAVRGPHEQEMILKSYPALKELFESGNQWYFPVKK